MAVAEAPFDLLDVKLAAPVARPDTVAKAELIARLRTSREPVVTVVAGAGYGKTTLLARWDAADPRPFAWVALDGREDEVVLLRYVAAAIHSVEPVPDVVLEALSGPRGSIWSTRVPRLISALAALERPMVLVLDDLHAVSRPSCIDVLAALLEYVPAGSQVAIVSREEPALPLARWRAQGRVHEIGVTELRLDDHEAGQLLKAAGTDLDADALAELTEHTEGWPAGLYLAALSQRAGANPVRITDVAGDDRFVSDYFRLELLSRLPPEQARFLKYTSVLERMSGALCDAVLETAGSANELERLERTNCFVVPLDRKGEWYRYHHLFGELLRTELGRSDPGVVASLSGRAMAWCIANDLPEEAVEYAHAAGEMDTLAGLLDTLTLPLHYDGRTETVDAWLRWFKDEDLVRYPALAVYGAWIRALTGRPAEAERWLALADGATSTIALSDGSATIEPWIATLRAHMMRDGVEQALADAELALDQLPAESPWIPTAPSRSRRRPHPARGDRACDGGPDGDRREGSGARVRRGDLSRPCIACAARRQDGGLGPGRRTRAGGSGHRRRGGSRRALVERARPCRHGARRAS